MTYPSNDHSIDEHNAMHYPSSSGGGVGSFWAEKKASREDDERWWNSKTPEQRKAILAHWDKCKQQIADYNE